MKHVNINIRLTEGQRDKLNEIAKSNAQNVSGLIRMWIDEYIKENTKED